MTNLSRKQVGRSQARNNGRAARKAVQFRPFSGSNNRLNTRTAAAAPETLGEVVDVELIDASTQSYAVTVDIGDGKKGVGTVTSAIVNAGDSVAIDILDAKTGALSINSVIPSNIKAALEARVAALKAAGIDTAELEALAASSGEAAEAAQKQALLAQADAKIQAALGEGDAEAAKARGEALTAAAAKLKAQYDAALKPLDDAALAGSGGSIGLRDELLAYLDVATEDLPYQPGQEVSGTVVSSHLNGVIVDLGGGVRGLLPTADLKVPSAKTGAVPQDPLAAELKALLSAAKSGDEDAFQAAAAPILARRDAILAEAQALLDEAAALRGEELPVKEAKEALEASLAPETYQRIAGQVKALEAAESGDAAAVTAALELINGPRSAASEEDDDVDDDLDDEDNDADGDLDGAAYLDAESSDRLYGYQALRVSDASKIYAAGDSIDVYVKDTSSGYVLLSQYSPLEEKHTALVETSRYIEDDMPELAEQLADDAFGGATAAGIDIRPAFSEHAYAQTQLDALDAALAAALSPAQKKRLDTIKETLLLGGGLSFADETFLSSLSPVLRTNTAVRELVGPLGGPEVDTAALGADDEGILAEIAAVAGEETAESLRAISSSELYDISFEEIENTAEASRILSLNGDALQAEIAKVLGVDSPDVSAADEVDILADLKAIEKAAGIDLAAEMKELFGDDADAVFETDLSALPDDIDFSASADADEEDLDLGEMGDLEGEDAAALANDARKAVAASEDMADRKYDLWDVAMDYAKGNDLVVDEGEIEIMDLVEGNVDDEFAAALVDLDRVASQAITDDAPSTAGSGTVAAMRVLAASVGVSAAEVKALRDATGAGMMDCKKALLENGGDAAKATEYLRQKGLLSAGKKAGRVAAEGLIKMYVHPDARFGILLEVNCETDFVAGNDKFFELVNDLCVQLLPDPTIRFVSVEDVPPEVLAKEIEIETAKEDLASKPEAMRAKIAEGRVQKNLKEQSLMEAKWWKDEKKTVAAVLKEAISTLGENIKIRRFQRITLGEGLAKKEDDLAKEVAAATQAQPKKEEPKKEEPKKEEEAPKPVAAVQVSAAQVKALRDATGAGMMDCKKALLQNGGDATAATEWLRKKGLASAVKKAGRAAAEGLIVGYIHPDCRFGLVVEVNCETDFVAGNQKFYEFAQSIAVSIASNKEIQYVDLDDIPKDVLEAEKAAALANPDLEGKPEEIKLKIVEGRVAKAAESMCLMNQPFVYDPEKTVAEVVKETISTMGENIKIRRFLRYDLGSGIEKKQADLAAEVAAMTK